MRKKGWEVFRVTGANLKDRRVGSSQGGEFVRSGIQHQMIRKAAIVVGTIEEGGKNV